LPRDHAHELICVQTEPDLDSLVSKVDEALDSHKFCQARIDAVKKLLDEKVSGLDPAQP